MQNLRHLSSLRIAYILQKTWPNSDDLQLFPLGSVSAVAFDTANNVLVFHRGDRVWNAFTFNFNNEYMGPRNPIGQPTIMAYNRNSGKLVYKMGTNMFYMPHGITVDPTDASIWVTDVALHQVMKLRRTSDTMLHKELVLGEAFVPGANSNRFCKPTAVAILPNGDFFVADGYCNSRIIKFSKTGERLLTWGKSAFTGYAFDVAPENVFAIPHALALAPEWGLLCVADRENGRVQCFHTGNGTFHSQYHSPVIGDRLFGVAYAPIHGGQLFVLNGPTLRQAEADEPNDSAERPNNKVMAFVIDMKSKKVISKFADVLMNPHDVIVSDDGSQVRDFCNKKKRSFYSIILN